MGILLKIAALRKRIFISGEAETVFKTPEGEGYFVIVNGERIQTTISIMHRRPTGRSMILVLDCLPGGFDIDERLVNGATAGKQVIEFGSLRDDHCRFIVSKFEVTHEIFGDFLACREASDQEVFLNIGLTPLGPFIAYEPEICGGMRHLNIDVLPSNVAEQVASALRNGKACEVSTTDI